MLSKDKLVFDATDVENSDQVGSHLLGTGNVKITSTTVGGKEALDVNDPAVLAAVEAVEAQLVLVNSELDTQTSLLTTIDTSLNVLEAVDFATETTLSGIKTQTDKLTFTANRLQVIDAPNTGFSTTAASVGTTALELAATPLTGRSRIMIQNLGTRAIYIGFDNTVTSTTGLRVSAGAFLEMPFGDSLNIFAIASEGTQDIRIVEIA